MVEDKIKQYGVFLTPVDIFEKYIFDNIKNYLNDFVFVDFFCGTGNLILPILNHIDADKRVDYFKNHIFMFDILQEQVDIAIKNAKIYGIPENLAKENIKVKDSISDYPTDLINKYGDRLFHITNPPYLSTRVIGRSRFKLELKRFKGDYSKFTDIYQLALYNDIIHGLKNMIYIIPSNFIFATTSVKNIRHAIFEKYNISNAVMFEKRIFDYTGTNVGIFEFVRNNKMDYKKTFTAKKIYYNGEKTIKYELLKKYDYAGGTKFYEFLEKMPKSKNYKIFFKLKEKELNDNRGNNNVVIYYTNTKELKNVGVNENEFNKIKNNILYARIVDGGRKDTRIGLYDIRKFHNEKCDGIASLTKFHRVGPIEVFINPQISLKEQEQLINRFNYHLEKLRHETDSDFLLTFQVPFGNGYIKKYMPIKLFSTLILICLNEIEKHDK